MSNIISRYASLVKFSHTIFAMPFALASYVYALTSNHIPFSWLLLLKIVLCMVFARNSAMGFNRWADRKIDAANPRTAGREIPSGKISPKAGLIFVIINAAAFVITTAFINKMTLLLSPIALLIALGYSLTKRFTAWSHIVLGTALAVAPMGAYIAVTGTIALIPVILAAAVISWVAGFDILYSLQDAEFDREHNLHSIPARFSTRKAVAISIILHIISVWAIIVIGLYYGGGVLYITGSALFIALLIVQHILFTPSKVNRIAAKFGFMNGLASITYAIFFIADMLI